MTLIPEVHRELRSAVYRRRRPQRRPLLLALGATATAAVAATIVLIVLALAPAGSPVDVLGRAEAALTSSGRLLHYTVTSQPVATTGGLERRPVRGRCVTPSRVEVWETDAPRRWRAILPPPPSRCDTIVDRHRNVVRGPQEQAWNNGVSTTYLPANRTLDIVRGYNTNSSQRVIPIVDPSGDRTFGDGGPIEAIRRLIADRKLKQTGTATLHGRAVRVLSGGRQRDSRAANGEGYVATTTLLYAVDAKTYEPVRAISTIKSVTTFRPRGDRPVQRLDRTFALQLDFSAFDQAPLDATNSRQLTIEPSGTVHRTDMTLAEFRREIRRSTTRENREGRRNAQGHKP